MSSGSVVWKHETRCHEAEKREKSSGAMFFAGLPAQKKRLLGSTRLAARPFFFGGETSGAADRGFGNPQVLQLKLGDTKAQARMPRFLG